MMVPASSAAYPATDEGVRERASSLNYGVLAAVAVQMALLWGTYAVFGKQIPLMLVAAVGPTAILSLFEPFVGLALLFAMLPFDAVFSLAEEAFTASKLIAVFVALGFLMRVQRGEYSIFPVEPIGWLSLALGVFAVLSGLWAYDAKAALQASSTMLFFVALMIIGTQMINTPARVRTLALCLVASATLAGLMMTFRFGPVEVFSLDVRLALGSTNVNAMARVMAYSLFLGLYLVLTARFPITRVVYLGPLPFILIGLLLTKSRSGLAGTVLGVVAGFLLGLRGQIVGRLFLVLFGLGVAWGGFRIGQATGAIRQDIFERWERLSMGAQDRLYIALTTLEVWVQHPAGVGFGNAEYGYYETGSRTLRYGEGVARDPHNSYLRLLAELGLPGLGLFVAILVYFVLYAYRSRPGGPAFLTWAAVMLIGMASVTAGKVYSLKAFWYILMMQVGVYRVFGVPRKRTTAALQPELEPLPLVRFPEAGARIPGWRT